MKKLKLKKGADVWILGREEENAEGMMLPEILKKSMKNLRYCKMERTGENYVGTIKMPRQEKAGGIAFAFYLEEPHSDEDGGQLMIEEESGRLAGKPRRPGRVGGRACFHAESASPSDAG